ncbi:hypothetical protein ACFVTE_18605 [Arthrobacter sp. NPDC058097]|uniref:ATP-dependent DNA ligase n=1 Tax=Arthrobacter sp. NPDC058097 TaxID=3346340 RepID=UPI0036DFA00C
MAESAELIPPRLRPPLEVALAKSVKGMPRSSSLPGQMLFEPKVDGYRLVIFSDAERTSLWSRQGKDLTKYFPELCSAIFSAVPPVT